MKNIMKLIKQLYTYTKIKNMTLQAKMFCMDTLELVHCYVYEKTSNITHVAQRSF